MTFYSNISARVNVLRGDDSIWEGTTPEQHHIDFRYLQQVTLSNEALAEEILDLFERQITIYLIDLRKTQTREDLMYTAHTIKGAARSIGALDLSEISAKIEREALYPNSPDTTEAINRIHQEIDAVILEIGRFREKH